MLISIAMIVFVSQAATKGSCAQISAIAILNGDKSEFFVDCVVRWISVNIK